MKKILIVEDDHLIAEIERDYLEINGYEVEIALEGREGLRLAKEKDYDLLILDLMLPGISGFEICREIRKEKEVAIIMVTAKKEDIDKIRGLGLGADDYVVKPFSPAELVARVKAHISIHERLLKAAKGGDSEGEDIVYRNLRICPLSRRVYINEREIVLTNKEYELLLFLAENPNVVFSKETLFDRIWGMEAMGDSATVTVHINRLRDKMDADEKDESYIETVWGAGYRFQI